MSVTKTVFPFITYSFNALLSCNLKLILLYLFASSLPTVVSPSLEPYFTSIVGAVLSIVTVFSVLFPALSIATITYVPSWVSLSWNSVLSNSCSSPFIVTVSKLLSVIVTISFLFTYSPLSSPAIFGAVLSIVTVFSVLFPALSIATITYVPSWVNLSWNFVPSNFCSTPFIVTTSNVASVIVTISFLFTYSPLSSPAITGASVSTICTTLLPVATFPILSSTL